MTMLFPLGNLVATPGALAAFEAAGDSPSSYIHRHLTGDFGELDGEDKAANFRAVRDGERVFSSYSIKDGSLIWIITERDRSVTTLLTPEEY